MNNEDLQIFKESITNAKGIELVDKNDFILCLVHFNDMAFSEKFYYLLYKYDFNFILKEQNDMNYDIAIEFHGLDDILVSNSDRNKINYKPFKKIINDGLLIKITTGITLDNGSYLEIGKHINVKNPIIVLNKNLLN